MTNKMTPAQMLAAANWTKIRYAGDECGEELKSSGGALNGLACKKIANWNCPDGIARCAQHAAALLPA